MKSGIKSTFSLDFRFQIQHFFWHIDLATKGETCTVTLKLDFDL